MLKAIKKLLERNSVIIAILITLFIAFISLVSLKGVVQVKIDNSDKYGHLVAYTVLAFSWLFSLKNQKIKKLLIVLLVILYGIILEALQDVLTNHRQADLNDILANTTGVIIALIIFNNFCQKPTDL